MVRYPFCGDLVSRVGVVPLQPAKFSQRRRLGVFQAYRETVGAANYVKIQGAVSDSRIELVMIRISAQHLLFGGRAIHMKTRREAALGRKELHCAILELQHREVSR